MKATHFTSNILSSAIEAEIVSPQIIATAAMQNARDAFQRRCVYFIAVGHFFNDAYAGFLSPLLPILMERLDFSLSRAGILASVLSAATSLAQPIFGAINDRFNRRVFVFLGPLLTGIFMCSLGYATSYEMLIPLLLCCGLGSAMFHPAAAAMVSRLGGSRREWSMSLFISSGNIGHAMSPLFVVPVVLYWGFPALPVLIFPVLMITFLLFRRLPEPQTLPILSRDRTNGKDRGNQRLALFLHLAISILRSVMITGFGTFIPVYMHARGHSLFSAGATTTIFQCIGAMGALLSGHFATRVDRRRMIIFTLLAAAPLLASFVYFSGGPALLGLALSGILLYFSFPLNIVMAQELYPHRSSMISALMIGVSWGVAGLFMTPLGFIAEKVGLSSALLTLTAIGFVAAFIAAFLPKD